MSTTDLIILGILMDQSMNAYELARFIDERQLWRLVKISKPAVYKCCKRLYKAGYLDGETVREGEMPEKIIYTINPKGTERFYQLMEHFSGNLNPYYFEFNSFLWNIERLDRSEALEMLGNLGDNLKSLEGWITLHEQEVPEGIGFAPKMIIKQYRMVVGTLVEWVTETIDNFKTMAGE